MNYRDGWGESVLFKALRHGNVPFVLEFVRLRADTTTPNALGQTPRIIAEYAGLDPSILGQEVPKSSEESGEYESQDSDS